MMDGPHEIERARSALFACDAGCSRDEWVRIGMAAKDAGLGFDDFHSWSEGAPNYHSEHECQSAWSSFCDGAVKAATLYHAARNAGWHDPIKTRQNGAQPARVSPPTANAHPKPQAAQKPRIDVSAVFGSFPPATIEHPYIAAKRGTPDGLRVVPHDSPLAIKGKSLAGYLAVPARSLDGELLTIQYVPPPGGGDKLNVPGASFGDGVFVVGEISADGRLYVCEGIGQAWAVARADYHAAAAVTFGAGRFHRVGQTLRTRFPNASLVFVADRGKEAQVEAIARGVGGAWVEMPADSPANYDCNDFEADHGSEALATLLQAIKTPPMRYRLQAATDLMNAPPPRWLVRGVLPAAGLAALFGPSGSGKSFLAFDLCAAIADGSEWFGRRVTAAPVIYICLEGEAGFGKRAKAWSFHQRRTVPKQMRIITQQLDLRQPEDITDIADAVLAGGGRDGLLVIDTLNRAAPGADENSSKDMGELIDGAKELQRRIGGVVLLVHHTGKDVVKGMRGHSSLYAALDAAVEVSRADDRREWSIAKSKDDEDGARAAFRLQIVELGEDEDGEPVTSCVIEAGDSERVVQRVKLPQGSNQKIAHDAIGALLRTSKDFGKGGAPTSRPCVAVEAAVDAVEARMPCAEGSRRYVARRAVTAMVGNGLYMVQEGWLWRA